MRRTRWWPGGPAGTLLLSVAVSCRPVTAPVPVVPEIETVAVVPAELPPIPLVQGPLQPRVVYPRADQMIQAWDSAFVLGSIGNGMASLAINGQSVRVWPNGAFLAYLPIPRISAPQYELVAVAGSDTARLLHPVRVPGMEPPVPDSLKPPPNVVRDTTPAWVILGDSVVAATDTDRVVIGRPGPNETYRWFLIPGTRAQLTARYPGYARVRLDSGLEIWVLAEDADTFASDTTVPRRVAGNARVSSTAGFADLIIPMSERPAFFVDQREQSLELTLYGTRANTDRINFPTSDSLIRRVEWTQERDDRVRYSVHLNEPNFGYLALYESGSFILRVRRPPAPVSADRPLDGLIIAVDPGHPPGGATGPTGLYEGDAALAVAQRLQRVLNERGAEVVMTRSTREPVDLHMRPIIARQAGAHAFVSLHYDAYGDSVDPFRQPHGVEVYFYRAQSEPLARAVQSSLLRYHALPDQGVDYRSLAVVRNTWMPAVLVEGGVIIIPEHENAMRTEEFQERYARAVADGLEEFFRGVRSR
jgi:N-acetylmuramoyl-L-alanine amidase